MGFTNLTNKQYDIIKWIIAVVLPAVITLVQTVGEALSWAGTDLAVTIIGAVTIFLGSVFMISSTKHQKSHITLNTDKAKEYFESDEIESWQDQ